MKIEISTNLINQITLEGDGRPCFSAKARLFVNYF